MSLVPLQLCSGHPSPGLVLLSTLSQRGQWISPWAGPAVSRDVCDVNPNRKKKTTLEPNNP